MSTFAHTPLPDADRRAFSRALDEWAGKPAETFSRTFPPCNEIADGHDETAILAKVFRAVAADYPLHDATRPLAILSAALTFHERQLELLWTDAKSARPGRIAPRTT